MDHSLKGGKSGSLNQQIARLSNSLSQELFIWIALFVVLSPEELYSLVLCQESGIKPVLSHFPTLKDLNAVKDAITRVPGRGK